MEGWRDGGMEGWRDGGMEGLRDGGMEATATVAGTTGGFFFRKLKHTVNKVSSLRDLAGYVIDTPRLYSSP
jgi:hypothetical protein